MTNLLQDVPLVPALEGSVIVNKDKTLTIDAPYLLAPMLVKDISTDYHFSTTAQKWQIFLTPFQTDGNYLLFLVEKEGVTFGTKQIRFTQFSQIAKLSTPINVMFINGGPNFNIGNFTMAESQRIPPYVSFSQLPNLTITGDLPIKRIADQNTIITLDDTGVLPINHAMIQQMLNYPILGWERR